MCRKNIVTAMGKEENAYVSIRTEDVNAAVLTWLNMQYLNIRMFSH